MFVGIFHIHVYYKQYPKLIWQDNDWKTCICLPEIIATQDQMNLAQLPVEQRDYCAQYLMKLMKCKRDNWPNFLACKHERHDWDYCEHQE